MVCRYLLFSAQHVGRAGHGQSYDMLLLYSLLPTAGHPADRIIAGEEGHGYGSVGRSQHSPEQKDDDEGITLPRALLAMP